MGAERLVALPSGEVQERPRSRGRHAPPLEVRQDRQRARLFAAASAVFARVGFADATAEAIAREAGMSKATFYEHFGNKEECILALFDAAIEVVLEGMREAARATRGRSRGARPRLGPRVPRVARALPRPGADAARRDHRRRPARRRAPRRRARGGRPVHRRGQPARRRGRRRAAFASTHDAFAIVGAFVELASRQLRTGDPRTCASSSR